MEKKKKTMQKDENVLSFSEVWGRRHKGGGFGGGSLVSKNICHAL